MDSISKYSEMMSIPGLLIGISIFLGLFFIVPSRMRLSFSLVCMVVVLTLGKLSGLGAVAGVAKILSGPNFCLVTLSAIFQNGPRRCLPLSALVWPLLGVCSFFCVLNLLDRDLAMILRLQWLVLCVSALFVVRTIVDDESLKKVVISLFIGFAISCLLTLSSLIIDPVGSFPGGFGRFKPYGANPNQVAIIFSITAPLAAYLVLRSKQGYFRFACLGILGIAVAQSLLTVSRSSMLMLFIGMLPIILEVCRRPILVISSLVTVGFLSMSIAGNVSQLSFHHVDKGLNSRTYKTMRMFPLIEERPFFGLSTSKQQKLLSYETNAHNAYVQLLYFGGLVFAVPSFLLFLYAHYSAWKVWIIRKRLGIDPLLVGILCAFSLAIFVHGFINDIIHYPTYTWAFMNVLLGMLFCSVYADNYLSNESDYFVSC